MTTKSVYLENLPGIGKPVATDRLATTANRKQWRSDRPPDGRTKTWREAPQSTHKLWSVVESRDWPRVPQANASCDLPVFAQRRAFQRSEKTRVGHPQRGSCPRPDRAFPNAVCYSLPTWRADGLPGRDPLQAPIRNRATQSRRPPVGRKSRVPAP